jgi:amino acid transporter
MAGWVYTLALLATIASVSYGAGPFLALILGFSPSTTSTVLCALGVILVATLLNLAGTRVMAQAAIFGFGAELAGAVVVGVWLLTAHREHGLGVIFHTYGAGSGGSYTSAFLASCLIGLYLYYGFEACGDVAEEVADPGRRIPKAMRMTIYVGGAASIFVASALVLSVPDFAAVISGKDADPVYTVLENAFGSVGTRIVLAVVLISFLSCALSLQAAGSRLLQSYGRDHMIFGSKYLAKFSHARHVPPYALAITAILPALVILGSTLSANALTRIVSFASLGIYVGFQMIVLAALRARLKGWKPSGKFSLGGWGLPVNVAALVYGVLAAANMAWPRTPDAAWYDNYLVLLSAALVVGIGLVYLFVAKPDARSDAPAGDAVPGRSEP